VPGAFGKGATLVTTSYPRGEVQCVCGSGITTRLRCSRCGKPICYECMVESPVGFRCQECSSGRRVSAYRASSTTIIKALGVGLFVAAGVGYLWGNFPAWGFYMALLLGFGTAEGMARASNYKRGNDLQMAAYGMILIGLVISRYTIIIENDSSVQFVLDNLGADGLRQALYLRLIPDFVFMAIPFGIAYIRFR